MSTKAKTETDELTGSAGGLRSEPVGRAEQAAGGAPLEIPDAVRDRLSDEVIDELLGPRMRLSGPAACSRS
jgi:hypothetical protein